MDPCRSDPQWEEYIGVSARAKTQARNLRLSMAAVHADHLAPAINICRDGDRNHEHDNTALLAARHIGVSNQEIAPFNLDESPLEPPSLSHWSRDRIG